MSWLNNLNPIHDISVALHAGDKSLHAGERVAEDGAKELEGAFKDAAKVAKSMSPSQIGHTALDALGMVPVVGTAANLANAGWYAAQGDWKDAAWSAAAAIPVEGGVADAAKLAKDGVEIAEDGAKAGKLAKMADVARSGARLAKAISPAVSAAPGAVTAVTDAAHGNLQGAALAAVSAIPLGHLHLPVAAGIDDAVTRATDREIIRPDTQAWKDAARDLRTAGDKEYRVSTKQDAEQLLSESGRDLPGKPRHTDETYKFGYEHHANESRSVKTPHLDLPHIKWKDWRLGKKKSGGAWGHIFYGQPEKK